MNCVQKKMQSKSWRSIFLKPFNNVKPRGKLNFKTTFILNLYQKISEYLILKNSKLTNFDISPKVEKLFKVPDEEEMFELADKRVERL